MRGRLDVVRLDTQGSSTEILERAQASAVGVVGEVMPAIAV